MHHGVDLSWGRGGFTGQGAAPSLSPSCPCPQAVPVPALACGRAGAVPASVARWGWQHPSQRCGEGHGAAVPRFLGSSPAFQLGKRGISAQKKMRHEAVLAALALIPLLCIPGGKRVPEGHTEPQTAAPGSLGHPGGAPRLPAAAPRARPAPRQWCRCRSRRRSSSVCCWSGRRRAAVASRY